MKYGIEDTSIGTRSHKSRLSTQNLIEKYEMTAPDDLTYGHTAIDRRRIIFITGKNTLENDIPLFNYPVPFTDILGNNVVALDVRNIIRKDVKPEFESLDEYGLAKHRLTLYKVQAIFMLYGDEGEVLNTILKNSVKAQSGFISRMLGQAMMLNIDEVDTLNVLLGYLLFANHYKGELSRDVLVEIILKNSMSSKLSREFILDIVRDLDPKVRLIKDMISVIVDANISRKLNRLDVTSVYTIVKSGIQAHGADDLILLSFEHLPTWIALFYASSEDKMYGKTMLASYTKTMGRYLDLKEVIERISGMLNTIFVGSGFSQESMGDNSDRVFATVLDTENHTLIKVEESGSIRWRLLLGDIMDGDKSSHELINAFDDITEVEATELEIIISSRGGVVDHGARLYNIVRDKFGDRVSTVLNNSAASMASSVFAFGVTKRVAYEFSHIMYHTFSGVVGGKSQGIIASMKNSEEIVLGLFKRLIVDTGYITLEEFQQMKDGKDLYYTTPEMCSRGIITHVRKDGVDYPAMEWLESQSDTN